MDDDTAELIIDSLQRIEAAQQKLAKHQQKLEYGLKKLTKNYETIERGLLTLHHDTVASDMRIRSDLDAVEAGLRKELLQHWAELSDISKSLSRTTDLQPLRHFYAT